MCYLFVSDHAIASSIVLGRFLLPLPHQNTMNNQLAINTHLPPDSPTDLPPDSPPVFVTPLASSLSKESLPDTNRRCRICWEYPTFDESLLSPCKCKGTMELVHADCWESCLCYCSTCGYPSKSIESSMLKRSLDKRVALVLRSTPNSLVAMYISLPIQYYSLLWFLQAVRRPIQKYSVGLGKAWIWGYGIAACAGLSWALYKDWSRKPLENDNAVAIAM